MRRDFRAAANDFQALQLALRGPAATAAGGLVRDFQQLTHDVHGSSAAKEKPLTLGVGESFTTTLMVVGYFALLFSLPVILYQLYAFLLPALTREERRVAVPAMAAAPALFAAGALFTYFEVLPPAVHFLQGYNASQFQILVGAGTYYKITASTLTVNWRIAVVIIAVIAAALPGVDPVTMAFETAPLLLLYLASIVLLQIVERRARKREAAGLTNASADPS
jgi:sec-independent protein translocase protein TatC